LKSTIRFNSLGGYRCKQLNLVTSDNATNVENVDSSDVLVIRKYAKAILETDYEDKDFTLKVKSISMQSAGSTGPFKVTVFVTFGYTHTESGLPAVITVYNTAKDLEISKVNDIVTIKFDNTIIDTLSDVRGPIKGLRIKPVDGIIDPADVTSITELCIGDIEYSS